MTRMPSSPRRPGRRVPSAVAATAGLAILGSALAACGGADEPAPAPAPAASSATTSSSTSAPSATVESEATTDAAVATSVPSTSATAAAVAPATSELPAVVVTPRGPCHRIGDLAQAPDGSPLFCVDDPAGAGPLWLPAPAGGGAGGGLLGRPCIQEGVSVTGPDGTVLTCRLTGGGDVPGGLFWQ